MRTRNRVLVIIAVVVLSVWALYPPDQSLKLGLDLNGGVQLVLRVKTDDPSIPPERRDEVVDQARRTIERRVNELGVSEAEVARYTGQNLILVQLPGVSDVDRAKQVIKSTAQLRLTLVDRGPFASREEALLAYSNALPPNLQVLPGPIDGNRGETFYAVERAATVAGMDLKSARQSLDEYNRPAVAFTLTQDAARRFAVFTGSNIGRGLATVIDDRVQSVATIQSRIDDEGRISGLSYNEMLEQVINLNTGALPASLEYVEERMVGASLGAASVRAGVAASLGGLALVLLFMLGYYRKAGINALASVALNLLILLAIMAYVPVTLTLPGIAGLILTIGMGVDSNVLIFERIKEELAANRGGRSAVAAAFKRVWLTIVDTHVTSLVAAAFLYQFGTTPIRGFATTLSIGLLANVFTAVFVSRTAFELALRGGPSALDVGRARLFGGVNVNFTRWRRHALAASALVIAVGMAAIATRGLGLGIDFTGGTMVVAEFANQVTEDQVRAAVAPLPGDEVVQRYGAEADRQFLIRLPLASPNDTLETSVQQIKGALEAAGLPGFTFQKRELVSAMIGGDLQRRGIYATLSSLAAIAVYIAIRFRPAFAIGAGVATIHDVLVTLAFLSLAGYDLTLNVVAALLTIIGYSVNDTIVVFDRVRENAKSMRGASLDAVITASVNQTLSRTVITAGTAFLSVMALYLFGGEALRGFAFAMLVGIAAGTYSTVFIASAITIVLSGYSARQRSVDGRRQRLAGERLGDEGVAPRQS